MLFAIVNEHGLNEGVLDMDPVSAKAHPLRPGWRLMAIDLATSHALKFMGHAARHQQGHGWHRVPDKDVRAWNRARGFGWSHVLEEQRQHEHRITALAATGALDCLKGCPDDLAAPPTVARVQPVPALEIRPGLVIREMTAAESLLFAEDLVDAKLYEETAEETRLRVESWYGDPHCWPMAVTWQGEPLEFESYHFLPNRPGVIQVSFNVRRRRDRPYRFWREVFRPYFEHLRELGITTIESRVRGDRPAYVAGLIQTYGAERLSDGAWVGLRYSIDRAIALGQGWPDPVTAGPGWQWSRGDVQVREATAQDLVALPAQIDAIFRFVKGRETAQRILRDWTALDGATVLLGTKAGALRYARIYRKRADGVAAWASLLPYHDEPGQALMAIGIREWARVVGYVKGVTFVPKSQYEQPTIEANRARAAAHIRLVAVHEDGAEPVYELENDYQ